MTEETIIDGVDVARCCCYENGKCLWTKRYYESGVVPDCEKIKVCYYKQLKRLEQENKDLKKQIEAQKGLITVGGKQQYEMTMAYDKCKTALEEINLILDELKQQYDYMTDYSEIKEIQNKINEVLTP